ncbi:hypothetical protein PHMEG_00014831 [Phytophthora megakarya]|uniref:Ubiquitin-like protease family profile domain-containing protein n=1 Tax=Phytophthora megakarya TaxID=4795 RepID=A0A225W3C5_9STRA|nr:hypothetical protein PHMEG_00014831 [Phytophthora megakarya]
MRTGLDHWSFIIVENALQPGPTALYHINSLKGAHYSDYAFDLLKWFLVQERQRHASELSPFPWEETILTVKPQQSNMVDCGLFVLHYMDKIWLSCGVSALPRSIKEKLKFWVRGTFNAGAVENFRADLQQFFY